MLATSHWCAASNLETGITEQGQCAEQHKMYGRPWSLGTEKSRHIRKSGPQKKREVVSFQKFGVVSENWENILGEHSPFKNLGNQRRLGEKTRSSKFIWGRDLGSKSPSRCNCCKLKVLRLSSQTERWYKTSFWWWIRQISLGETDSNPNQIDLPHGTGWQEFLSSKWKINKKKSGTQVPHPQKTRGIKQFSLPHTFP